jgi:hypothetical protein
MAVRCIAQQQVYQEKHRTREKRTSLLLTIFGDKLSVSTKLKKECEASEILIECK